MKDELSYLFYTQLHGFILIEKNSKVLSSRFLQGELRDRHIFYSSRKNSYFMLLGNKIYKKKIDKRPFSPYMIVNVTANRDHRPLPRKSKFSKTSQKLLLQNNRRSIFSSTSKEKKLRSKSNFQKTSLRSSILHSWAISMKGCLF